MSETYADLGGGLTTTAPTRRAAAERRTSAPRVWPHVHEFDALSGWCACGRRDDTEDAS